MPFSEQERELQKAYFRHKLAAEKMKVEVAKKVKEGKGDFVLLDTRDRAAYERDHLPGALAMPLDEVDRLAASLQKDKEYVTYCWHAT
jgi:rhodanese-related sulfurtransferase